MLSDPITLTPEHQYAETRCKADPEWVAFETARQYLHDRYRCGLDVALRVMADRQHEIHERFLAEARGCP